MRFFHLIALTCLLQEYRLLATGFPGEPDLGFELRISPTAVLPLSEGRLAAAGFGRYGTDDPAGVMQAVVVQPDGTLAQVPWVLPSVFSAVYDIDALPDGSLLISGTGRLNGGPTGACIAKLDSGGSINPDVGTLLALRGEILETVLLPEGRMVVAGWLTDPTDVTISGVARLHTDGAIDRTFLTKGGARADGRAGGIFSLKVMPGGEILAGGEFLSFDGVETSGLVRLLPSGEYDGRFRSPLTPGSIVRAIALQPDGRILIAGDLRLADRLRSLLIRLNPDGSLDPDFQIPDMEIPGTLPRMGLVVDLQGRSILSGVFLSVNGLRYRGIARFDTRGIPDPNFAPFARYSGDHRASGSSRLAIGLAGEVYHYFQAKGFEAFDPGIIRLRGGDPDPAVPAILYPPKREQAAEGDRALFSVHVTGFPTPTLQWFSNGLAIPGATNQSLVIQAVQRSHNGVLSVTASNQLGSASQEVVALLVLPKSHTAGMVDTSFRLSDPVLGAIYSLRETADGQFILAGHVSRDERTRILRFGRDGVIDSTWWVQVEPLVPLSASSAHVLPLSDGGVLVGGRFGFVNGFRRSNLALLTRDGLLDPQFVDRGGASAPITALLRLKDGRYCVAGGFTNIQGVSHSRLTILKPNGAADETFTPPTFSADAQILQLFLAADGGLVVAGRWSQVDGVPRGGLLKIGLEGQVDPLAYSSLTVTSAVAAAYADGRVVAAVAEPGSNPAASRLMRFLADGRVDASFQPPGLISGGVFNLTVDLGERVIASGLDFLSVDGTAFRPLLRFLPDGRVDTTFARDSETQTLQRNPGRFMMPISDGRLAVVQGTQFVLVLSDEERNRPPTLAAPFVSRGALPGVLTLIPAPVEGENLRFSWVFNGLSTTQTTHFFRIPAVAAVDFGEYSFVARNDFGAVTSPPARLFPLGSAPATGKIIVAAKSAFPGEEVVFPSSNLSASSPLRFQWYRNDQPVLYGTGPQLWLPSVASSDVGYYQLEVSNPYGQARGSVFKLSVPPQSFVGEALDLPGARWVADDPQLWKTVTDDTSDGVDAVKVGPLTSDLSPWLQTRLVGPGTLTFRWKLGDPDSRYSLVFILSSSPGATLQSSTRTRTGPDWETVSVDVPSGVRYPTWVFKRGSITGASSSFASLDSMAFTPKSPAAPTISRHPASVTLSPGATLQLSVSVQSQLPIQLQWFRDHVLIPGASGQILEVEGAQATDSGEYEVRASNSEGSVTSLAARVSVTQLPSPLGVGTLLPGGGLQFTLTQEPGRMYRLQTSDNLNEWFDLDGWTSDFTGSNFQVLDPLGATGAHRFYRAILDGN